jgi:hypothetical protein
VIKNLDRIIDLSVTADGAYEAGETRHVDHEQCGDRRGRLYITRAEQPTGTAYLAYCHNCGEGGRHNGHSTRRVPIPTAAPKMPDVVLPGTLVPLVSECAPEKAIKWASDTLCMPPSTVEQVGWSWDTHTNRVCLPIEQYIEVYKSGLVLPDSGSQLLGYQLRRVFDYGPKYLTVSGSKPMWAEFHPAEYALPHRLPPFVLVEDWASAFHVARTGAAVGIPLFRSMTTAEHIVSLKKKGFDRGMIWLDNDNPEVNENSGLLLRICRAVGIKTHHISTLVEPKLLQGAALASIIEGAF